MSMSTATRKALQGRTSFSRATAGHNPKFQEMKSRVFNDGDVGGSA
jgi:hypothetical protein